MKVIAWRRGSVSARNIGDALSCKVTTAERCLRPNRHPLLNWGCSRLPLDLETSVMFNKPRSVLKACDKLLSFQSFALSGVPHPDNTRSHTTACEWLSAGFNVYGRDVRCGHGGQGITVYTAGSTVGQHLFYTKGFLSHRELRVHIVNNKSVVIAEKRRRRATSEPPSPLIRSHRNNWVFCTHDLRPFPESVIEWSKRAVLSLGLDFGAVDIAFDRQHNVCVYEVNTAPGIEGSTVIAYANAFREILNG